MLTQQQIKNLKKGDKLIFIQNGMVLMSKKGNVFTFSNFFTCPWMGDTSFWQSEELISMGNYEHNFGIEDVELFDENIHKEFVVMNKEKILQTEKTFIEMYGE